MSCILYFACSIGYEFVGAIKKKYIINLYHLTLCDLLWLKLDNYNKGLNFHDCKSTAW